MPWVDSDTGNWSLTRTAAIVALWCFCHVAEHSHTFTFPAVMVLGIIAVMMFSKNISDFSKGAGVLFRRRSTDSVRRVDDESRSGGVL